MVTNTNLIIGDIYTAGALTQSGNTVLDESQQTYRQFAGPTTNIQAFSSVDDFKVFFGLASGSPAIDAGNDALAATDDLEGSARPFGPASDLGCYGGAVGSNPPNPCANGIQDGDETGVDCGGSCPDACPPTGGLVLPGQIEAEQYTGVQGTVSLVADTDADGTPAMLYETANARLNFAVDVQGAGTYVFTFRARTGGRSNLDLYVDGTYENRVQIRTPRRQPVGFYDYSVSVSLTAGQHVIGIGIREAGTVQLNWFSAFGGGTNRDVSTNALATGADRLFPNPATDVLDIRLRDDVPTDVDLLDVTGRVLLRRSAVQYGLTLPVADLTPGIYLVRLTDGREPRVLRVVVR